MAQNQNQPDPDEKPIKRNDHGMDAMRMLHHSLNVLNNPNQAIHSEKRGDRLYGSRDVGVDIGNHWTTRERAGTGRWKRESVMGAGARAWPR